MVGFLAGVVEFHVLQSVHLRWQQGSLMLGVKKSECEADHSPPSVKSEVRNE